MTAAVVTERLTEAQAESLIGSFLGTGAEATKLLGFPVELLSREVLAFGTGVGSGSDDSHRLVHQVRGLSAPEVQAPPLSDASIAVFASTAAVAVCMAGLALGLKCSRRRGCVPDSEVVVGKPLGPGSTDLAELDLAGIVQGVSLECAVMGLEPSSIDHDSGQDVV